MQFISLSVLYIFPLLAAATGGESETHPNYESDWTNPWGREEIHNHMHNMGLKKRDIKKRDEPFGEEGINVYFCRGADQTDCDRIPVSASSNCYNNQQWHGWTTTDRVPLSVKIDGPTCCAFYPVMDCNKKANPAFEGFLTKVCGGDTGNAAKISGTGTMMAYMCNIPYGSAGKRMDKSPPNIIPIPTNLAPQQHT